ncbi:tripartite tricarboxylate transporter substrate binding protein [Castellaniella sp. FW104-16D08]|uniref:Bug family tripartite tricarboxylate transporter substrate binding protein n=1 Tax=unclassified Castellaniella TaxID=2617606 RepID=UPI0033145547
MKSILKASIAAVALGLSFSAAAEYPDRPITMIVPAAPGGGTDTFGRKIADLAEKILNQQITVENRGGGSGTVGMANIITARPDGYTIGFVWNSPLTTLPHSLNVPYSKDNYSLLMSIGYSAYTICAHPDFPANNGAELLAELKKHPGKYTLGNDGAGGTMQFAAERIFTKAGVKVRPVPFKGAGETAKNFLGGHVDLYGGSIPPIEQHVKAGKAKCLLMTSADRNSALPDASSLKDIGMADEETVLWWGLVVPAKTPANIQKKLEDAFLKADALPEMKTTMNNYGAVVRPLDAAQTKKVFDTEYAALGQVAKAIGLSKKDK